MPYAEPVVLEGRAYTIRHIGPQAAIWPNPSVAVTSYALLNQPAMVARPLPVASIPNSPDFVSGSWTTRLKDAGEFSLNFPNKEASDGQPWRNRFAGDGKNQWIEIYNSDNLEGVYCIEKPDLKRDQIVITGHDGFFQTKGAYERDWVVVMAPRDVIERGTQVWVGTTADDFSAGTLNPQWTTATGCSIAPSGGCIASGNSELASNFIPVQSTGTWRCVCSFTSVSLVAAGSIGLEVEESTGDFYDIRVQSPSLPASFTVLIQNNAATLAQLTVPIAPSYQLMLESDGEWIWGFCNGQLIGCFRRGHATTTSLLTDVAVNGVSNSATLASILTEALQPFLMRGSDKGDYVLPGDATTYPSGGLHARYYNDGDLQADANRLFKILGPNRSQAYAGSGTNEYANQQDATISNQQNPQPGAATSNWSVKWFGAIYLKLSAGDYTLRVGLPAALGAGTAVRIWVGKTKFGDQIAAADQWTFGNKAASFFDFTISASALAGTLPYSGGAVQRNGWYPIKIEYAVDSTAHTGPNLTIQNSPTAYTDPGGTAIASGAQSTVVPSTSLSTLGCVDERLQGISHFDMITKKLAAFDYQAAIEPQSLESGLFPGVLAPRIREGQDFDAILEPDDTQRTEGLLNYGNTLDATDIATSIQGNGAGFQNGVTGQLQEFVYDHTHLSAALFDIQAWVDFSDASYSSLLHALLNSQLGLRLDPWQLITGDPIGRNRLAFVWPLTGALSRFIWHVGDGVRVRARDVAIEDTAPRQLLLVTRQIHPNGSTATQVGFAARPRSSQHTLKQVVAQANRWARSYQKQLVTLSGAAVDSPTGASGDSPASIVNIGGTDQIVRARLRVAINNNGQPFSIKVNGVDQTAALCGAATILGTGPFNIDLGPVATADSNGRLYVALHNGTVALQIYDFQIFVDVLR